ncbi:myb-like protein A [Sitodiplosis mosellana]|uniref:myb-like protein A n=1 Tax=Sitodiplosis mosellana TaxID=263140 RepID=UPI002443CA15|nr:myb-like protein A [Sitodiplosis mosellana]
MENLRKQPGKKLKNVNASQLSLAASSTSTAASSFAYKHFNSTNNKRRKNRKKYFEHDTRTRTIRTSVTPVDAAAAIKKIKFNNEIRIVETKCNNNDVDSRVRMRKKKVANNRKHTCNNTTTTIAANTNTNAQKKRAKQFRRTASAASNAANIQSTTKKLQKQLIETQKKLQQQLNALQKHQREQNHSFLALLHSNCASLRPSVKHDTNSNGCTTTTATTNSNNNHHHHHHQHHHHNDQLTQANSSQTQSTSIAPSTLLTKTNLNPTIPCSEHYFTHNFFTDQSKCSIDKMANGNKATAIRAFTCESKSKNCSVSRTDPEAKLITSPNANLCTHHHCSSCSAKSVAAIGTVAAVDTKKPKIHIKKPLLKSIILSTNNSSVLNIKREIDIDSNECDRSVCPIEFRSTTPMTKTPDTKTQPINMQFTDTKKTKQINSYIKSNDHFVQENARSYSPPLPANHPRLASIVSSDASNSTAVALANSHARRSHSSRDRKCSKKRKKRQRSYSRESRSRTRSYSRSRSSSRSRTRSRSRSYRRRSSRSRSSNSEYESRRYSQERKKKSHSKNRDVFRRSSKRDERSSCGCSCNCTNFCKKSASKHSTSAIKSKSPSNDNAFSSKQSNVSPSDSKSNKRSTTSTADANGSTSKKKPVPISSGVLLKQQPIVKLHSSPATGSDTENEVDDKFDRKYEELLTFETNEDERREQRLLKALSDIAAKAKQKIQSISESNVTKSVHADRNHNDRSASKPIKTIKICAKKTNDARDDRRSERQSPQERFDDDFSPHDKKPPKRDSSKRSRRDSYSSTSSKEEKSPRSSRSPSIPRRRGSPSFLDRRRITSARKKPIPYQRSSPYDSLDDEWESS